MIKEASLQDLQMMFLSTLIRYKELPVLVENIFQDKKNKVMKIELYHLTSNEYSIVDFNEKEFNFKPIRLGYVNHRGFAVYIYRQPYRKFKQGLHKECLIYVESEMLSLLNDQVVRRNQSVDDVLSLWTNDLCNTIISIYPSLKEAIIKLNDGALEVAFDRQFAICNQNYIRYKGKIVGTYQKDHIEFKQGFEFLKDAIRKDYEI